MPAKKVSQYLKKYVKELDDKALRKLLRFTTGSDILLVDKITIDVHELQGSLLTRRPVAHTYSCVFEHLSFI